MTEIQPLNVEYELEQIAKGLSEADAARVRTLIYLASRQQTGAVLPEPLNELEVTSRLVRLMRGAGSGVANRAFAKYFDRKAVRTAERAIKDLRAEDLGIDMDKLPRTLKSFYRKYPEIKGSGFPTGYPVGKGPMAQAEWCRKAAVQIEIQRAQTREKTALLDINGMEAGNAPQGLAQTPDTPESTR